MRLRTPGVLLALVLLASPCLAWAQGAACQSASRHLQWEAGAALPPEICISPDLSTTVLFERALEAEPVELEGRERFRRVEVAGSMLVLVPSQQLKPGERLTLKVRVAGAEGPRSLEFKLVVHPGEAERQVEVSLAEPAAQACAARLQEAQTQLQQCRSEPVAPRAATEGSSSLQELIAAGLVDEQGLRVLNLHSKDLGQRPEEALKVKSVMMYRTYKQLALLVEFTNPDPGRSWVLGGAALLAQTGQALPAVSTSKAPGKDSASHPRFWLEWGLLGENAQQELTLKLWDEGKTRPLTVQGLRLP